jgi:trigger factor
MAGTYNMPIEQIKQALGSLEGLKEDLKIRKAIDFLVENSKDVA